MALTLEQRINLFKGFYSPGNNALGENWMELLITAAAMDYATNFLLNVIDFPLESSGNPINQNANNYKNSMVSLCKAIVNFERFQNHSILNSLKRVFTTVVGLSSYTPAQISGADWSQWETFALNNIQEVCEIMAGVLPVEKSEYESLLP